MIGQEVENIIGTGRAEKIQDISKKPHHDHDQSSVKYAV
jgi:hypothetical protein